MPDTTDPSKLEAEITELKARLAHIQRIAGAALEPPASPDVADVLTRLTAACRAAILTPGATIDEIHCWWEVAKMVRSLSGEFIDDPST